MEKYLGWDTACIQARPPYVFLFHKDDLGSMLSSLNCGHITSRPTSDYCNLHSISLLKQYFQWMLQHFLQPCQEHGCNCTVNCSVVSSKRQLHDGFSAYAASNYNWGIYDCIDSKYC